MARSSLFPCSGGLLLLVGGGALLLLLLLPHQTAGDQTAVERSRREPVPVAAAAAAGGKSADPAAGGKPTGAATKEPAGKAAAATNKSGKDKKKKVKEGKNAANTGKSKTKGKNTGKKNKIGKGKKNKTGKGKKNKSGKGKKNKSGKSKKNKSGKGKKNKSGKGKKSKSGKGKKNKSGKGKKNKSGKGKKNKNGKGKKNKSGKSEKHKGDHSLKSGGVRAQNDSCITDLISILAPLGSVYSAISKQAGRIKTASGAQDKKKAKSGDFGGSASTLLQALGGSMSNLTCGSNKITPGSGPEYGNLSTLNSCNQSVLAQCSNSSYPPAVDNCATVAAQFFNATQPITKTNQTADQICAAVANFSKSLLGQLTNCTTLMKNTDADMASKRNNCTAAFASCRAAQRNSIGTVYNCKPGPGGAANKDDAQAQVNAASNLRNAAANLENKLTEALTKAGLNSGPGSDGNLPTTTGRATRQRRQSTNDGAGCVNVLNGMKAANQSAGSAVGSITSPVDTSSASSASSSMDSVANSNTLATDLGTCAKDGTAARATVIIAIVQIRVYMFWIRNWRVFVLEIKITILSISFPEISKPSTVSVAPTTTASTAAPTTTISLSTRQPSAGVRRERIFQLLKQHVQLN